jgi:hypothetical protein
VQSLAPTLAVVTLTIVTLLFVYRFAIRPWHLRWGATHLDVIDRLPGDGLTPRAAAQITRAVNIDAPPEAVWPWIVQIGQERCGFYSYTFLENLAGCDTHNTERIVPEWQQRAVGDTVWFSTPKSFKGGARMVVAIAEPPRDLALSSPADWKRRQSGDDGLDGTWEVALQPKPGNTTRVLVRLRTEAYPTFARRIANFLFWEPAHFIMERKMLLTIKGLSERAS